jgi:hypothetical protein
MEWYINQDIIAIKNSQCGKIKKGQEFTIKGLKSSYCKCKDVLIDIGIKTDIPQVGCYYCNIFTESNGIGWKKERLFAPLDFDISELTKILEEPIKEYIEK